MRPMLPRHAPRLAALGLFALATLAGCATDHRAGRALPEEPPEDFGLAVTVFPADAGLTPARYIAQPDGSLRAATGPGAGVGTFPPVVRLLDHDQRRRLWWLTLDTRAHDPTGPWAVASPDTLDVQSQGAVLVTTAYWGARTSAAIPQQGSESIQARALVEELERLAWVKP